MLIAVEGQQVQEGQDKRLPFCQNMTTTTSGQSKIFESQKGINDNLKCAFDLTYVYETDGPWRDQYYAYITSPSTNQYLGL